MLLQHKPLPLQNLLLALYLVLYPKPIGEKPHNHCSLSGTLALINMVPQPSQFNIHTLRHALEKKEWTVVKRQLGSVPTFLPAHASGLEIAEALDTVRQVADVLVEVCSFRTAFETAYEARRGLLRAGVCEWAVNVLKGFRVFLPVVERIATVLGLLGIGIEERSRVGKSGAVDLLTTLWRDNPLCLEAVSTLASLCAGHIDNVSRIMRQRGLVVAMHFLNDPDSIAHHELVKKTLLLVGQCAICTPDNPQEACAMVPSLLTIVGRLTDAGLPQIVEHAISAFANITDCWLKENYGYSIPNYKNLVVDIIKAWSAFPRSRTLASSCSRALLSLMSIHCEARAAVSGESETVLGLLDGCRQKSTTIQALRDAIKGKDMSGSDEDESELETSLGEFEPTLSSTQEEETFSTHSEHMDLTHEGSTKRKRGQSTGKSNSAHGTRSSREPSKEEFEGQDGPVAKKRRRTDAARQKEVCSNSDSDIDLVYVQGKKGRGKSSRSRGSRKESSRTTQPTVSGTGLEVICISEDDDISPPITSRNLALRYRTTAPKKRTRRPTRKRVIKLLN